jgi:hypothetical protein
MLDRLRYTDWAAVIKGAMIASAGAGLAYLTQWASGQDFGPLLAPLVGALLSTAVNALRKLATADV